MSYFSINTARVSLQPITQAVMPSHFRNENTTSPYLCLQSATERPRDLICCGELGDYRNSAACGAVPGPTPPCLSWRCGPGNGSGLGAALDTRLQPQLPYHQPIGILYPGHVPSNQPIRGRCSGCNSQVHVCFRYIWHSHIHSVRSCGTGSSQPILFGTAK